MKPNDLHPLATNSWLSRYAKAVVFAAFVLIFTGGHTTSSGAGMAFPDWPLSHGSLNPEGWWENFMMRLEHGHRLTAGFVAILVAGLFVWVLRQRAVLPKKAVLLSSLALVGVLAQALLGGLRVVLDPQGIAPAAGGIATVFRVLHGCFAQAELCLLVAVAAIVSPAWKRIVPRAKWRGIARLAWITSAVVSLQLIVGATMRHLGAGLAIPTFPLTPEGGFMPKIHNAVVDLNFTHTRFGAAAVTVFVLMLLARVLRRAGDDEYLARPALIVGGLLVLQLTLGVFVIWKMRPPMLATLHVVNGAALLATAVLLAVRASHGVPCSRAAEPASDLHLTEAAA